MKKLVTISVILVILLSFAVAEMVVDASKYTRLQHATADFIQVLDDNKDDIGAASVLSAYRRIDEQWRMTDGASQTTNNHTAVRALSEKITALGAYIHANVYSDAYCTAKTIEKMLNELKREKYPLLGNIF